MVGRFRTVCGVPHEPPPALIAQLVAPIPAGVDPVEHRRKWVTTGCNTRSTQYTLTERHYYFLRRHVQADVSSRGVQLTLKRRTPDTGKTVVEIP